MKISKSLKGAGLNPKELQKLTCISHQVIICPMGPLIEVPVGCILLSYVLQEQLDPSQ